MQYSDSIMRRLIGESNGIEDIFDPAEVEQSLQAWHELCARAFDFGGRLANGIICHTQKIITLNQDDLFPTQRGYYRSLSKVNVIVGNYRPPMAYMVDGLMNKWLLDYEKLGPWEAHVRFEKIHPFVDGNGRTGRMLMWWQEQELGQEPTVIVAAERQAYYRRLEKGRSVPRRTWLAPPES